MLLGLRSLWEGTAQPPDSGGGGGTPTRRKKHRLATRGDYRGPNLELKGYVRSSLPERATEEPAILGRHRPDDELALIYILASLDD